MSGIIRICYSTGGGNKSPIIRNFRQEGEIKPSYFYIKYTAEDFENTILRHYIYINGKKKDISKDVGYESIDNEFTYKVDNLNRDTKYEVQIEVTDGIDTVRSDIISVTTANYSIFGIKVMENNSNPNTCCSYIEEATGLQSATNFDLGDWKDKFPFNQIKLVGFKNGKVVKTINPNNKKQYIDGSIVSSDVDVMVEIPKVYWSFTNISNGYELRISNYKVDGTYDCYAHKVNGIEKDFIYVGAYLGSIRENKLRSISEVNPRDNVTLTDSRYYAQANGNGYQQWNWYTLMLIQILYLIAYKNLDSQSAIGLGYTNGNIEVHKTGGTDTKGLIYGETSGREQMCFLGIEDLWGNLYQWVDGMFHNKTHKVLVVTDNKNFNDTGSGYKDVGDFVETPSNVYGQTSEVAHTNEGGFFPSKFKGSNTTHYCDYGDVSSGFFAESGGCWYNNLNAGIFCLYVAYAPSVSNAGLGSRLVFLG